MEKYALVLIVLTNVFLVFILAILVFLVYRLYKQNHAREKQEQVPVEKNTTIANTDYHPAILERFKEAERIKSKRSELFCPNHPDEPGEVTCAICDHLYCRLCIKPFKSLHFCKEHLPLLMNKEWVEVLTIKTSTKDPEEGVRMYDLKKKLFQEDELPTYIETHYKINVDKDFIETYLVVFAITEDAPTIKEKLASFAL
jgi:hypothetical protein